MTRFVASPDGSTITVAELASTIEELKAANADASSEIQPFIDAQIPPLETLREALSGGGNTSVDFSQWKASGIELINQCKPYLS
jgi:hypothetical protein